MATDRLAERQAFIDDVISRQGLRGGGHTSVWMLERFGARLIIPTAFEPDAATYRGEYYYNAITNALYRRVITRKNDGVVVAHWQQVST